MPSEAPRAHPLRALRHRNFKLFFSGQLISLIGTWMQQVAQSWLIFRMTHSPLLLGFVGFSGQIPSFILGPIGGHIADALDRRRTLVMTQTASMILAFVLAALTLGGVIQNWHIFVLAALLGLASFAGMPYTVLMPVFADDIFHSGARGLGILLGASGGGALIGSVMLAMRQTFRALGTWVAIASGTFGPSAIAFGLSRSFILS